MPIVNKKKKLADGAEEALWVERKEIIEIEAIDSFVPAIETPPTPEEDVLIRIEL